MYSQRSLLDFTELVTIIYQIRKLSFPNSATNTTQF